MKIQAPAKINLFLEIGTPVEGFHPLVSLVDIVGFYDDIEIEEVSSTSVVFYPETGIPKDNTVTKSISLLKTRFNIKKDVQIKIRKNIPVGSGLGGGSSDAASVLKSLAKMWNLGVSVEQLMEFGSEIGKDVPLFIAGRRCIMSGFGEQIDTDAGKQPLVYFLAVPPFSVSTKQVYSHFDIRGVKGDLTEGKGKIKLLINSIEKKDIQGAERVMKNRLEQDYFGLWRCSKEVRDFLQAKIGKRVFVSGSGGTLFSIFRSRKEAEEKTYLLTVEGWNCYIVESTTII